MAFVPHDLPQTIELDASLVWDLDEASRAVAMLAGVGETLANPHLLVRPFLKREAVLSSRIEGTVSSVSDLFLFEATSEKRDSGDTREVHNYVKALDDGLRLLDTLPLCMRLLNQLHAILLEGVRGSDRRPGELRTVQNWIGSTPTTPIEESKFIPPPPDRVADLLARWERFINDDLVKMPPLIRCALMHYQFETIHPYIDGNGRIGRLAIILFLCAKRVLPTPLLYLSDYFERNHGEYYDHLYNVSLSGNWTPWLRFFLQGVKEQSNDALIRSRRVRQLHDRHRGALLLKKASARTLQLLDQLFVNPYISAPWAADLLGVTHSGAQGIIARLQEAGIVKSFPGVWPRVYVARELLHMIEAPVGSS